MKTAAPPLIIAGVLALALAAGLAAGDLASSAAQGTEASTAQETDSAAAAPPPAAPPLQGTAELPPVDEAQELFLDNITVNVVNVEVVVTDKDGQPVRGLAKEDFELFEDGRPMEITNFYAVDEGVPQRGPSDAAGPESAPPGADPLAPLEIPEDQRLNVIVFIDHFNIHALNRNRVMRDLRQFLLQTLTRDDRVMLVSYTRSLKVEQRFTSDPRLVVAALASLEKNSGMASLRDSERDEAIQRIEDTESESIALSHARLYAESVFNDLTFTIRALKEMVEQLAGLPGRKMIVHVSDGIPMVAGQEVFLYVDDKFRDTGVLNETFTFDASRYFQELVAMANANRVTFYPLDAAGLRTSIFTSASRQGAPGRGALLDSTLIANLQDPLHFVANGTGGRAIVNRNRPLEALREVSQDFRNFYSLGFSPSHAGTGRSYKIKVKLVDRADRRAYDLRYRDSYRDKSVETQMSDGTLAALNFAYESNPMDLQLEFGQPIPRAEDKHFVVPVQVRIPLGKVTLVPVSGKFQGRVRLFIAAQDYEGATSPVQEALVPISIPEEKLDPEGRQHYIYSLELLMRRGGHEVAVGMRDDLAGESSFVTRRIDVGAG